jgi:hypothetical protein
VKAPQKVTEHMLSENYGVCVQGVRTESRNLEVCVCVRV